MVNEATRPRIGAATRDKIKSTIRKQLTSDPQLPRAKPTESLWQLPIAQDIGSIQSPRLPEKVDFAIIGSGVASCGVTRSLLTNSRSGNKTVGVFEARGLCSGATGRNGGQLTRLPPTRHTFMAEEFGVEQANKVMRLTVRGLHEMHSLAESQGPEFLAATQKTRTEKFFAYFDEESWNETVEAVKLFEAEIPEEKGAYELVSKEDTASVYNINGAYGGLRFPAGVCAPYRLVTGTFKSLMEKFPTRLSIDSNTPIVSISHTSDEDYPYRLETPRGTVKAANVVHCTNGHAGHLIPGLRGKMYPRRGTMSVQSPGSQFPDLSSQQSWSFYFTPEHNPAVGDVETGRYYCFQSKETGHLWIGGDRDSIDGFISADDSCIDVHAEKNLRGVLPKLFSKNWVTGPGEVRGIWTGIMCYTGDQLPFIGRLPASVTLRQGNGEWIAGGWNTYGMTNGLLCGDALGKIILGEDVFSWFPESYIITEERLGGQKFETEAVMEDYFKRIGATQYVDTRESRL